MKKSFFEKAVKLSKLYTPEISIEMSRKGPALGITKAITDMFEDTYSKFDDIDLIYENKLSDLLNNKKGIMLGASGLIEIIPREDIEEAFYIKSGMGIYTIVGNQSIPFNISEGGYVNNINVKELVFSDKKNNYLFKQIYDRNNFIGENKEYRKKNLLEINLVSEEVFRETNLDIIILKFSLNELDSIFSRIVRNDVDLKLVADDIDYDCTYEISGDTILIEVPELDSDKYITAIKIKSEVSAWDEYINSSNVYIGGSGRDLKATVMNNDTEIKKENEDYIFKERFAPYDFFYLASLDILSHRGSEVLLELEYDYAEIPYGEDYKPYVDYKMVMKERDFAERRISKVTIDKVIWEYYNGNSWKRLFFNNEAESCFDGKKDSIEIRFIIPEDIVSINVKGIDNYFIRCRVDKISNIFNLDSVYLSPKIRDVRISHSYKKLKKVSFNLSDNFYKNIDHKEVLNYKPLRTTNSDKSIYISLDNSLCYGSSKIYFNLTSLLNNKNKIEISTIFEGDTDFRKIDSVDFTNSFNNNGYINIKIDRKMRAIELFGQMSYWLKIDNVDFSKNELIIGEILLNIFPVVQEEEIKYLYYKSFEIQENNILVVAEENITDLDLWVNEKGLLSTREVENLVNEGLIESDIEYVDSKDQVWVKWKRVKDISNVNNIDRLFAVDFSSGRITFNNSIKKVIVNNQSENVLKLSIKKTMGSKGNILDKSQFKSRSLITGIKDIKSITPLVNGRDTDNFYKFLDKNLGILAHKERLVTKRDYEKFIITNLDNIIDVKVKKSSGYLRIIIDTIFRSTESHNVFTLKKLVTKLMEDKTSIDNRYIDVFLAKKLFIRLKGEIEIDSLHQFDVSRESFDEEISKRIIGNSGWGNTIGKIKDYNTIYKDLLEIYYVKRISNLIVDYYTVENGFERTISIVNTEDLDMFIPVMGNNNIKLKIGD